MKSEKADEELVALIQGSIDVQENMVLLIESCRRMVYNIAKRYPRSAVIDLEDLLQEGSLGVMEAVESYTDQNCKFKTYAAYYVKQAIRRNALEPCLNSVRIPSDIFALIGRYKQYGAIYQTEFGEFPSDKEVIQRLGITGKQYQNLKRTLQQLATIELDSPASGAEDETFSNLIADNANVEESVLDAIHQNQCSVVLWGCLESLGNREAMIMSERYFDNMTLQEIADKHKLTNGRVGQIEQRCLELLRKMDEIKVLRDNFDYYGAGLQGTGFKTWKETGESSTERAFRNKEELETKYHAKLRTLESQANDALEDLKIQLMACEQKSRTQIEGMFNRKYDELIPYILELPDK